MHKDRRIQDVQEKLPQPSDSELYKVQQSCHPRLLREKEGVLIMIERTPEQQCKIVSCDDVVVEDVGD